MRAATRSRASRVFSLLISLLLAAGVPQARAEQPLIREVEDLKAQLPPNDPQRKVLNLRLGDLYFDEAGEVARKVDATDAHHRLAVKYRERAATCYKEALTGGGGLYEGVSGTTRTKVRFQLARIYADLGRFLEANPMWVDLAAQNELQDIKREATLRVAESLESSGNLEAAAAGYQKAIELCGATDMCAYAHYRKSWMLRNQSKYSEAIAEVQLALWDSKGQAREEALRDLILFLPAETPADLAQTKKALSLIDGLASKLQRPALLTDLSGSYFSAGNRASGAFILDFANARNPQLKHQIRLLEEYYGLRDWDKFHATLDRAQGLVVMPEGKATLDSESPKILQRLSVQLDGERITQPARAADFEAIVDLHLDLWPNDGRTKMMEGWLAAEKDPARKQAKIVEWLGSSSFQLSQTEKTQLHETRAAIAQKQDDQATVVSEMQALEALGHSDPAKLREYRYTRARALYAKRDYEASLPIFQELASGDFSAKWAVEAENLALDILGQKKDFVAVIAQAVAWAESPKAAKAPAPIQKELADIRKIAEQARFERAVAMGQTPEALATFKDYCLTKRLLPKSCENAKVLAVKLKDEQALIAILKETNAQGELAAEYEASGYFSQAADLLEKSELTAKAENKAFLRVALLREIAGDTAGRDRILDLLYTHLRKTPAQGPEEDLVYATLVDAGFGAKLLAIKWSDKHRKSLADDLEAAGKGNLATRKTVLSSMEWTGTAWGKLVLEEISRLDAAQKKITFYGKRGQAKFEIRLAALKKLVALSEKYLPGADAETRVKITTLLADTHVALASEIVKSPLPEGLPEENAQKIRESLQAMAKPFLDKADAYQKIADEQSAKKTAEVAVAPVAKAPLVNASSELKGQLENLHVHPSDPMTLAGIRDVYKSRGQDRVASYFEGRLLQTKKEPTQ